VVRVLVTTKDRIDGACRDIKGRVVIDEVERYGVADGVLVLHGEDQVLQIFAPGCWIHVLFQFEDEDDKREVSNE
jgi:hypothetical protein